MADQPKKRQPTTGRQVKLKSDPVPALMIHVQMALRYSDTTAAFRQLFHIAARTDIPKDWTREVRRLTKQLRRSVSFQRQATDAAVIGNLREAHRKLDLAEEALESSDGVLRVEFSGPTTNGSIDLWESVMKGAREMMHTTTQQVLGMIQPRRSRR